MRELGGGSTVLAIAVLWACASPAGDATATHDPPLRFEFAGVVEGFYGRPWSQADRLDILRFMGRVGLNTYVYAPKDDPYHRERWRDPYPPERFGQLGELADTARAHGVRLWYAISPGLTIRYSDRDDYETLVAKLDTVATLGVRHFALLLDDVPPDLQYAPDRAAFANLAAAHASLINELHADLSRRGALLAVTPTTYTDAWGDRDYLRALGDRTPPEVPFLWTGIDVASPEITAGQARRWSELTGRRPLVWDNYPVNDYARWRLFLGPFRGRGSDLPQVVRGILANPMNEAHASMIALSTLAAYAADPAGYDPSAALREGVTALYGEEALRALAPVLTAYGDDGWNHNVFEPVFIPANVVDPAPVERSLEAMGNSLTRLEGLAAGERPGLRPLIDELRPVVQNTTRRLAALQRDTAYRVEGGVLVYREALDRVEARHLDAAVDGDLAEWPPESWRPLWGPPPDGRRPAVAFAWDDTWLYIALDIPRASRRPRAGGRATDGDHVALVVDYDPASDRITLGDLWVFFPPWPDAAPAAYSMAFGDFMAKYLADNEALTLSEFFLSTFARQPAPTVAPMADRLRYQARRFGAGYRAEIALPRDGRTRFRMNLSVTSLRGGTRRVYSLSRRNYPANPVTFADVIVAGVR